MHQEDQKLAVWPEKTAFLKEPEQWGCTGNERWELQGLVEAWPLIKCLHV